MRVDARPKLEDDAKLFTRRAVGAHGSLLAAEFPHELHIARLMVADQHDGHLSHVCRILTSRHRASSRVARLSAE